MTHDRMAHMTHSDENSDNQITELTEFLSRISSLGPAEIKAADSEFVQHDSADLDVKFLLALLKRRHRISSRVSVPKWQLCFYTDGTARYAGTRCASEYDGHVRIGHIRGGIMFTNLNSATPKLYAPRDLREFLETVSRRFVVLNVGIYPGAWSAFGHANVLIIDRQKRTLDRFEPAGKIKDAYDSKVASLLRSHLPGYRYISYAEYLPGAQRAGTDSYSGMCVTFSLIYVLYRLLNPDLSPHRLRRHLANIPAARLKHTALRLNRYVADTLRAFPKGELVRQRIMEKSSEHMLLTLQGRRPPSGVLKPPPPVRNSRPNMQPLVLVHDRVMVLP